MLQNHEKVLNYFLEYRNSNTDFTFATRVNNRNNRLDLGYWFLGNDDYMFIPLFKRGDDANMTKTIGLVYHDDKSYIEITYRNVKDIDDNELKLYQAVVDILPTSKQTKQNQYRYYFDEVNLQENIKYYIEIFRPKCIELIKKYALEDKYFISTTEFNQNIRKIENVRKNLLHNLDELQASLDRFISTLELNNDNEPKIGLELFTSVNQNSFYVYKNMNDTVFTKPTNGVTQFSQSSSKILRALNGETINSDEDKAYIEPIAQYIKDNFLNNKITREDLLKVMVDFQYNIRPEYREPKKHYFKINGQETVYPRKYIVLRARSAKGMDNTDYTTDQAKRVLDSCFTPDITHINKEVSIKYFTPGDPLAKQYIEDISNNINFWLLSKSDEFDINKSHWEDLGDSKHQNNINKINVGDYVAIKHAYNTKNLPFDNHNKSLGIMDIKAIGRVVSNPKDSKSLEVKWDESFKAKQIYLYVYYKNFQRINYKRFPEIAHWVFYGYVQSKEFLDKLCSIEYEAIKKAKRIFKNNFPSFVDFNNPSQDYLDREYSYKVEFLNQSKIHLNQLTEHNFKETIAKVLKSTRESNVIGWRSLDSIKSLSSDDTKELYHLTIQLIESYENKTLESEFDNLVEVIQTILSDKAFTWRYITYILFVLDRDHHMLIQSTPVDRLLKLFNREALVSGHSITYQSYQDILLFIDDVKQLLEEWHPKDMIDMHSFFWSVSENINSAQNEDEVIEIKENNMSLNTILYGPPGTGKTYSTTRKALEIIEGKSYDDIEAKQVFRRLQDAGQIQMITFHQSYGYEEFVEGLSAETVNGKVAYNIKEGSFKKIAQEAKNLTTEIETNMEFDELYDNYLDKLSFVEDARSVKILKTVRDIEFELFRNNTSIVVRANNNTSISISKNALLQTIASGKAPYYVSYIPVVLEDILNGNYISVEESSKEKKYVLIIDEINRGNISKIFGELITLIEPSKRIGASDETKIILPYSKKEFSIPSNLYIIGTMNTADRSIAVLDTALRRRFNFEEMMPNIDLIKERVGNIDEVNVSKMLERINKRIEVLYDRDHTIGHAYFLDIKDFNDLQNAMKNRVIPLLQEYFYDDWQKINMVFNNNGFIEENAVDSSLFDKIDDSDLDDEQKVYTLNEDALADVEKYKEI